VEILSELLFLLQLWASSKREDRRKSRTAASKAGTLAAGGGDNEEEMKKPRQLTHFMRLTKDIKEKYKFFSKRTRCQKEERSPGSTPSSITSLSSPVKSGVFKGGG